MESSIIIATPKLNQISFLSCDLYKLHHFLSLIHTHIFHYCNEKNLYNGPEFRPIIKVSNFVQVIYAHLPNIFLNSFTIPIRGKIQPYKRGFYRFHPQNKTIVSALFYCFIKYGLPHEYLLVEQKSQYGALSFQK